MGSVVEYAMEVMGLQLVTMAGVDTARAAETRQNKRSRVRTKAGDQHRHTRCMRMHLRSA